MTSATVKEQAQSPQVLRMHRNRAIDSRIRGYLAMSAFLDKDEVTWKERKKILVHILVWKMEHGKEDITEVYLIGTDLSYDVILTAILAENGRENAIEIMAAAGVSRSVYFERKSDLMAAIGLALTCYSAKEAIAALGDW